ncbi:MAG: hypothetical protein FJ388_20585, partial [Verrucomicrobia bacterium]|nr:hypothetical protein [Verrucomicrobiota bacterium]
MKLMPRAFMPLVLLSLAAVCSTASGGEPPRVLFLGRELHPTGPSKTPPAYVKRATWHETMRASLEAAFGAAVEKDCVVGMPCSRTRQRSDAADRTLARSATGSFRPAMVRLTADGEPVRLEFRVAGVERLYFATLGRAADGSGSAHFLSPRVFDKDGRAVALELGGAMMEGKVDARAASATAVKIGETVHRGFALTPGEVAFKLDGKYERLEVLVCYRPERGLPPCA